MPTPATETGAATSKGLFAGSPEVSALPDEGASSGTTLFDVQDLNFYYGSFQALRNVNIEIYTNEVTALIGPSGCGKSTFLRCLNRMNDLIPGARVEGLLSYQGQDLHAPG